MRQSTRGDVQWSGGTSGPEKLRSRNFVRAPSGTASALVRLLRKIMALRSYAQSVQRNRVSGGPTWSEGHCLRVGVTMTHPPGPAAQNFLKAAAPPRGFAALATCAPLSGCVLSAGEPELGCYISTALRPQRSASLACRTSVLCCRVPVCVCVLLRCQSVAVHGQCSTGHGCLCGPCQLGSMAQRCLTCA